MMAPAITIVRLGLALALADQSGMTAPDAAPEARRLYDEGLEQFRAGNYDAAIAKLEASYARTPAPMLLYDLAQAHRLRRDCARALDLYRRFLQTGPSEALRARAQARVTEMELCAATAVAAVGAPSAPQ